MASAPTSQILADLADLIGLEATLKIVRTIGGQSRRIPHNTHADHWLTVTIGPDLTAKVCARYGGDVLWVPKNEAELRAVRDRRIRADRKDGKTINTLAAEYELTDRQIYNILGQVEDD